MPVRDGVHHVSIALRTEKRGRSTADALAMVVSGLRVGEEAGLSRQSQSRGVRGSTCGGGQRKPILNQKTKKEMTIKTTGAREKLDQRIGKKAL